MQKSVKFIDLFAGMGGFRLGFERACFNLNIQPECVFSSEIKDHARTVYASNFSDNNISGDITQIPAHEIPNFDVLLAGFPCQAFSNAGKRQGFLDTRGTMFFEIERILQEKQPKAFILENVEGLVKHDLSSPKDLIGKTLETILQAITALGYTYTWKVLDASNFGLAQTRKRIYIVGSKVECGISLEDFTPIKTPLKHILQTGQPTMTGKLPDLLLSHFSIAELYGKSVKDKRGGANNIHSWDIELKGSVSIDQRKLMGLIMRARRNKKWAELKGIHWMDGMPLTIQEISTFYEHPHLQDMLDDLTNKGYLKLEHPKDIVHITNDVDGKTKSERQPRTDLAKGYNIVAGKLSYEINKVLNPDDVTPTLVATDLDRVVVPDGLGIRMLTLIEQKRLFGFPDSFDLPISTRLAYDLFGNTVAVPVVQAVAERLLTRLLGGSLPLINPPPVLYL